MEKCADLLPDYYNFVRGVVDSADVSLNISARDAPARLASFRPMARRMEKKITGELEAMRDNDREAYEKFFQNFGRGLKYGIYSSYGMKKTSLPGCSSSGARESRRWSRCRSTSPPWRTARRRSTTPPATTASAWPRCPWWSPSSPRATTCSSATQDVDEFCFQAMRDYTAKGLPKTYEDDAAREAAEKAVADGAEPESRGPSPSELKNVASGDLDLASAEDEKKEAEEATKAARAACSTP